MCAPPLLVRYPGVSWPVAERERERERERKGRSPERETLYGAKNGCNMFIERWIASRAVDRSSENNNSGTDGGLNADESRRCIDCLHCSLVTASGLVRGPHRRRRDDASSMDEEEARYNYQSVSRVQGRRTKVWSGFF